MNPAFQLCELGNTYVDGDDRYIVSLLVGYTDSEVRSPEEAAHYALELTRDEDASGTHWYVYDRQTHTLHQLPQRDIETIADHASDA